MKNFKNKKIFLMITLLFYIVWLLNLTNAIPVFAKPDVSQRLDIVLAIDSSGSMKETDPLNLRITAAKIFIDLSDSSDRIGEVDFDESVKILSNLTYVSNSTVKKSLKKKLNEINSNGDTDFLKAFKAAETIFSNSSGSNRRKILVFLTDGEPHPNLKIDKDPSYKKEYMSALYKEVNSLKNKGIEVYSIGLSEYADMPLLRYISKTTNGEYFDASKASDLNGIFTDILRNLKNENIKSINPEAGSFDISPLVKGINILSTRPNENSFIYLYSPALEPITPESEGIYYADGKYYQIYIINNAKSGRWQVKGNGLNNVSIWVLEKMKVILDVLSPTENSTLPPNEPVNIKVGVVGRHIGENLSDINPANLSMSVVIKPTNSKFESKEIELKHISSSNKLGEFTGVWNNPLPGSDYWLIFTLKYKNGVILTKKIIVYGPPTLPTLTLEEPLNNSVIPLNGKIKIVANVQENNSFGAEIRECSAQISDPTGEKTISIPLFRDGNKFIGDCNLLGFKNGCLIGLKAVAIFHTRKNYNTQYTISLPNLAHLVYPSFAINTPKGTTVHLSRNLSANIIVGYKYSLAENSVLEFSANDNNFVITPNKINLPNGVNKTGEVPIFVKLENRSLINRFKNQKTSIKIFSKLNLNSANVKGSPIEINIIIPSWISIHKFLILIIILLIIATLIAFLIKWHNTPMIMGVLINPSDKGDRIILGNGSLFNKLFAKNSTIVKMNGCALRFSTYKNFLESDVDDIENENYGADGMTSEANFTTHVTLLEGNLLINGFPVSVLEERPLSDGDTLEFCGRAYTFSYYDI